MKTWIYSWIIYPAALVVGNAVGFFRPKVRDTLKLRSWKLHLSLRFHAGEPIDYWVHVASSGELEYAIPIFQELNRIGKKVLVTFYSVSARDVVRTLPEKFPCVALTVPLPHDGLGMMKEFVKLVRQQGVHTLLLLKYEMWPGLLWECNRFGVKVILVEALKPGWFHRKLIHKLHALLAGFPSEVAGVKHPRCGVVGDTRVARVMERLNGTEPKMVAALRAFLPDDRPILVCGSMWPSDHKILLEAFVGLSETIEHKKSTQLPHVLWLPHELDRRPCLAAEQSFRLLGFETLWVEKEEDLSRAFVSKKPMALIVFKKGVLVELYKLARIAFVGGGFGPNVHSVWEPALAGCAVACGPRTGRSPESRELAAQGLLLEAQNAAGLGSWLGREAELFATARNQVYKERKDKLAALVQKHEGAARRIVDFCEGGMYGED